MYKVLIVLMIGLTVSACVATTGGNTKHNRDIKPDKFERGAYRNG